MGTARKRWKKVAGVLLILWVLTLGVHVGTSPSGVPVIGTKDSYFWDEFLDGDRELHFIAFMEVPHYQAGIPLLFTYGGGAMPASVDLAVTTDQRYAGSTVVIDKASLTFADGESLEIVRPDSPRSGVLREYGPLESDRREGRRYYRTRIGIPHCVWGKQDFTIEFSGTIGSGEQSEEFSGSAGLLYSENPYVYPGWFLVFLQGV